MLKNSARNWSDFDSVIWVSLMIEKSRFDQPGPVNVLRPRFPGVGNTAPPVTGLVTVGVPKNPVPTPFKVVQVAESRPRTALEKYCGPQPAL
jgi:hypothetical protein